MSKRLLVIDGTNNFYRSYIVDPSLSTNGAPIGGVKGFVKILQKLCRDTKPDEIVICWDGAGGSKRRQNMSKGYKAGRKPLRLNRTDRVLTEAEERENKIWQQMRLIEYLNEMPVINLYHDSIEADDIISLAVQHKKYSGWNKVIVSSDKDFYQLCDDETVVLRPIQKEILNKPRIIEQFGIHPRNFALARAIAGDKSDNLPGIPGVGLSTVAKRFPFLREDKDFYVEDLIRFCEQIEKPLKVHEGVIDGGDVIKSNYKIMQLASPLIPVQTSKKIKYNLENFVPMFNKSGVDVMMIKDGFGALDTSELYSTFRRICIDT